MENQDKDENLQDQCKINVRQTSESVIINKRYYTQTLNDIEKHFESDNKLKSQKMIDTTESNEDKNSGNTKL